MKWKSLPRRVGNNEVEVTTQEGSGSHYPGGWRIMKWKSLHYRRVENNEVEVTTQEGGE